MRKSGLWRPGMEWGFYNTVIAMSLLYFCRYISHSRLAFHPRRKNFLAFGVWIPLWMSKPCLQSKFYWLLIAYYSFQNQQQCLPSWRVCVGSAQVRFFVSVEFIHYGFVFLFSRSIPSFAGGAKEPETPSGPTSKWSTLNCSVYTQSTVHRSEQIV